MLGIDPLRWLLTVAFGRAAVFHLLRCLRPPAAWLSPVAEHRLSEMLHLVMGLSMIVMIRLWGAAVPAVTWIVMHRSRTAHRVTPLCSRDAEGVALGDRLAEELHERRVDAWVRDAA